MIALASDHVGLPLKNALAAHLRERGYPCRDFGAHNEIRCDYPDYAWAAAQSVAAGECELGILCCGTGVGMSIAANKVPGVRCAVCSDIYSAVFSRRHNNANMLALGRQVVGTGLAIKLTNAWLEAEYEGGRHQKRLDKIRLIEAGKRPSESGEGG